MNLVRFGLREEPVAHHHVEHDALAVLGRIEMGEEIEISRLLRDTCQKGGLGERQVRRGLAEVDLGRGLRPVGKMPIVQKVEIHFQDLILGEQRGHLLSQPGLQHLAVHALLIALIIPHEQVAGELHGDRAGAGDDISLLSIAQRSACNARRIHAGIGVEGGVLGRDRCVDEMFGDAVERNPGAPALRPPFGQQRAAAVIKARRLKYAWKRPGLVLLKVGFDGAQGVGRGARA